MINPLVLDASTAVAEALRKRGVTLFQNEELELYTSEEAWSEIRYELSKRVALVGNRLELSKLQQEEMLDLGLDVLSRNLVVLPKEVYAPFETSARQRIPQDPNDWPSIALALAIEADIWTEDKDFFGCGLATWRTDILRTQLNA